MAKLTSKERNKLSKSEFAMPSERKYPINDASHARNALARASEMHNKGLLSLSAEHLIQEKAHRVLENKG